MSAFLSGRDISRSDYYESANYTSDFQPDPDPEDDTMLPGNSGGMGVGLGGGHIPTSKLEQFSQDEYAGYDPGLAGYSAEGVDCSIPGVCQMGSEMYKSDPAHSPALGPGATWSSRGYERDDDEYETPSPALGEISVPETKTQRRKPSVGSRIIGHTEELVGKVIRNRDMEAKGKRHLSGNL